MRKTITTVLTLVLIMSLCFSACGNKDDGKNDGGYENSLALMTAVWNAVPEDGKFSCYGGNMTENAPQDVPGEFDISDTDGLAYTLLIPESVRENIDNAASLVHMMNANTFTGAAVHVKDGKTKDAADAIKEAVLNNQFMCGFPDKLVILTTGDYVVYFFGNEQLINAFQTAAKDTLAGAEEVCDQWIA